MFEVICKVAEMQTGEGKTLTATLPVACAALAGIPVHVITVNDYLVVRDLESVHADASCCSGTQTPCAWLWGSGVRFRFSDPDSDT